MNVVLDASVLLKWFISSADEEHSVEALALSRKVRGGEITMIQPIHWQAEVSVVLARLLPDKLSELLPLLDAIAPDLADSPAIYRRAADIAMAFNHHLFDTLYHAVALERNAVLITADRKYFNKVAALSSICLLEDSPKLFDMTSGTKS